MLAVVLAASLAYLGTLHNYFVQDDFGVVWLLSQKPALYFPRWFISTWMDDIWGYTPDEIRPFPAASYQFAALWDAGSPTANHAINIAFHAGNGLLVLAVASLAAGLRRVGATFAALVFVILPCQAETVAWITGRVDSMPAFFYVASFLAYVGWRMRGTTAAYAWSIGFFFVALFSKQNTITLAPALVFYDALVARRTVRLTWTWARPYVPFVALTVGYLLLRYMLFGEVAREGQLTSQNLQPFIELVGRHLHRIAFGQATGGTAAQWIVVLALGSGAVVASRIAYGLDGDDRSIERWRSAVYFGVIWIVLGVAPIAVAGYESPRHIYLASLGWAIVLGLALDAWWCARRTRVWKPVSAVIAAALLVAYAAQLQDVVRDWNVRAAVSQQARMDLEREALAAAPGTLVIAGAPVRSWEWAMPFAAQQPFASTDLTRRVFIVSPWLLHCCRDSWEDYTRRTLRTWAAGGQPQAVLALHWEARTGQLSRLTDEDEPSLRSLMSILIETDSRDTLDGTLVRILTEMVAGRRR